MTYGYSTRAVKSPMATSGAHARVAGGRSKPGDGDRGIPGQGWKGKFVPLSVFFARMDAEEGQHDPNAVYGMAKKRKKSETKPKDDVDQAEKKSAKDKNADANRQTTPRSGSTTTAGDAKTAGQAMSPQQESRFGRLLKMAEASVGQPGTPGAQGLPVRSGASHVATGGNIHGTGGGNIPVAPIPLGPPLRRADWLRQLRKKKRKKKKSDP